MDCIFCKIAKGEIDSAKVYEDDDVLAFLDVNPLTKGHCLVVPKTHAENIFDISQDVLQKIIVGAKHISGKIKNNLQADGIRLSQSNGATAGQVVFHFHLHIIPRYQNDGVRMDAVATTHPPQADFTELKKLAEQIKV